MIRLRRSIGYVIQDVGLFPHFTVERNIGLVPKIEGWPEERIRARVQELLQTGGALAQIWRRVIRISCRAGSGSGWAWRGRLAADPEILLMDEPFGALDPLTRDELQREFLLLQQRLHKTVVFVTHDLREALRLGIADCIDGSGAAGHGALAGGILAIRRTRLASAYVRAFGEGLESAANRGTS